MKKMYTILKNYCFNFSALVPIYGVEQEGFSHSIHEEAAIVNEIKYEDQSSVDSFDQPATEQLGLSTEKLTCFKCSSSYDSAEELAR